MDTQEVLQQCTVEGNVVKLPAVQLDRKEYMDVKKALELIGGSWKGGKIQGFVFLQDPTELLAQIAGGEKCNLKKEYQFFGTPDDLANELVEIAFFNVTGADDPLDILEPEAGQGAIVKAINRYTGGNDVDCYELMPLNQTFLKEISTVRILGEDFIDANEEKLYDVIVANPPFTKNQDIQHIKKMWQVLKVGGRIVSMASNSWRNGSQKQQIEFRNWLDRIGGRIIDVEEGRFKESGTNVATCIVVIDK